jgi:phosphate starvation-inducible PhoH-like protein
MNNKGEDFTIKGENKHIAARVLQDLTTLSTSRPIEIYDVEMTIKACSHQRLLRLQQRVLRQGRFFLCPQDQYQKCNLFV